MPKDLELFCFDLLRSFVKLLELRNPFNIDHCHLVAEYSEILAKKVGLAEQDIERLVKAAEVHTLGVLLQMEEKHPDRNLPISYLGARTGRETSIHEREDEIFHQILTRMPMLKNSIDILQQRHEWFDGSGSILGFSGQDICPEARILAVADAYVDLVTPKAHRPPETTAVAIQRLEEQAGTQFDPQYVQALKEALGHVSAEELEKRKRKFRVAHARHYLGLGHFYTQIHETEWALRSYSAAERMAAAMEDPGLELAAISGRFMVFCDQGYLDRAREVLRDVRDRGTTNRDKLGYQLLWGLLESLSGNKLGTDILNTVLATHAENKNLPGLAAALGFQACLSLFQHGPTDSGHLGFLNRFMELVDTHDVFDVVERYRPYTIPVLLNAIVQSVNSQLARNLLTRMGEPCHGVLQQKLKDVHPTKWTQVLMPEPALGGEEPTPTVQRSVDECLSIETLGRFRVSRAGQHLEMGDWQTMKTIKLFLRLALSQGLPIGSEVLIEELWPEAGLSKGRDSLRNGLSQVRRVLKSLFEDPKITLISRSRKNQTLTLEFPSRFDFSVFEESLSQAIADFQAGSVSKARASLGKTLEIYQGDFLDGFDEEWIQAIRSRLSGLRTQALILLARCYLADGDLALVEKVALELIASDDLREEAHCLLIEALGKDGRPAEAVSHYEKAVDIFESEIGVSPESLKEVLMELGLML